VSASDDFSGEIQRMLLPMPILATVDLDGIRDVISRAHALGPFIDPTAYRDALYRGDMDDAAELARLLQPAVDFWSERLEPKLRAAGK
jgi:hypothetical protein